MITITPDSSPIERLKFIAAVAEGAHIGWVKLSREQVGQLRDDINVLVAANEWRPIETLGFGVDQHIIIATEYGFAWVVECDKDMDGEWLKRSYGKDAEHTGPVTHWRLLDLPAPGESQTAHFPKQAQSDLSSTQEKT